jgi:lipoyl(octanoyl) transferase
MRNGPIEERRDALHAYLLGAVPFDDVLTLQRRLLFQVSGDRTQGGLILSEHPPVITVGRHGSRAHILWEPHELSARRWAVRWVNRGGGCMLHVPGQLAIYSIIPVKPNAVALRAYLTRLQRVLIDVLRDFEVKAQSTDGRTGVWVGDRLIAAVGVAVRSWVTYYGAVLNVNPDLELFRRIRVEPHGSGAMTSLERERHGRVRPTLVRERLIEHFSEEFGFARTSFFHDNPAGTSKAKLDAIASHR